MAFIIRLLGSGVNAAISQVIKPDHYTWLAHLYLSSVSDPSSPKGQQSFSMSCLRRLRNRVRWYLSEFGLFSTVVCFPQPVMSIRRYLPWRFAHTPTASTTDFRGLKTRTSPGFIVSVSISSTSCDIVKKRKTP